MGQIISQWQAAIGEALNLAERLKELGENELAEDIINADENQDKTELLEALDGVIDSYAGEKAEMVVSVARAIALKISDEHNHHMVEYRNGAGDWLPRVPYGLEPYGLVEADYVQKDGYAFRVWTFPGSQRSEKLGALFLGLDFLLNEAQEPHIGFRLFFEQDAINETLDVVYNEENEIEMMTNGDGKDIAFYKCILAENEPGSVDKTISLLMNAIYDDETFALLEETALEGKHLHTIPGAEDIPNLL